MGEPQLTRGFTNDSDALSPIGRLTLSTPRAVASVRQPATAVYRLNASNQQSEGNEGVTDPTAPSGPSADVIIVNPLAGALRHYTERLQRILVDSGSSVTVFSVPEPSFSGRSRVAWIREYASALLRARRVRRHGCRVLVTWPALGHIDRVVAPLLAGRPTTIVMHDPLPLVRAVGYSSVSTRVATLLAPKHSLMVHSELAAEDLAGRAGPLVQLPHPLANLATVPVPSDPPFVRVLGQWKPDRDLALLETLAPLLPDARLEIVGRGWPPVAGWAVRDEFVSEDEMDDLINTSSAVLIPYRRYYQSGIAARAIEAAVPVIGTARELSSMTGASYPFLLGQDAGALEWSETIRSAIASDTALLEEVRADATAWALDEWKTWARS